MPQISYMFPQRKRFPRWETFLPPKQLGGYVPQESGVEPPFTPSSFGDLQIWFDASDETTLTTVVDGATTYVTQWESKGILDYPISAETTNRRPLYKTDAGDGTKSAVYFQNTGTTREILYSRGALNMETVNGFTMFWVGRYAGGSPLSGSVPINPVPITMWNSNYTSLSSGEGIQFGYRSITDRQPITSGSTTAYFNTYEVNYNQNENYLASSRYALQGFGYDYTQNVPTVQPLSQTMWEGNLFKSSTATSGYTSDFSTQGKNLNSFGMMGYKLSTSFIQNSTQNQPWEIFEVLVYNKQLTQSQFTQIKTYLTDKWNLTGSTDGKVVIDIDFSPGLQYTDTNYTDLIISGTTTQSLKWSGMWTNVGDRTILEANTDYRILCERAGVDPPKFNFGLFSGSGVLVTGATCFDAVTEEDAYVINLPAGNYTFTGNSQYDCPIPPTPSVTPSVTPTMTPTVTPQPTTTPTNTPTPSATGNPQVIISGGTVEDIGGYRIHTISGDTTVNVINGGQIELALIGGGASGGGGSVGAYGGGGGGGGFLYLSSLTVSNGSYSAIIGQGGASVGATALGNNGGDSSLFSQTAYGGGGGGRFQVTNCGGGTNGQNGANGGGGAWCATFAIPTNGGSAIYGSQGTNGTAGSGTGGTGGSSVLDSSFTSWAGTDYSKGGVGYGACGTPNPSGVNGTGNGGAGGRSSGCPAGQSTSGAGGSGVIKIRYQLF